MDADEQSELLDELESLRRRVTELAETAADARAQRIHQEALIERLRQELRQARAGAAPPAPLQR